jgi:hypothetical protein
MHVCLCCSIIHLEFPFKLSSSQLKHRSAKHNNIFNNVKYDTCFPGESGFKEDESEKLVGEV